MSNKIINPQFEKDSIYLTKLSISQLRLMKDGDLDWFILIPLIEDQTLAPKGAEFVSQGKSFRKLALPAPEGAGLRQAADKERTITDWDDLNIDEQILLCHEITYLCHLLKDHNSPKPDKINVANLGNVVSQFHVHVMARYKDDRAWPAAIWGSSAKKTFNNSRTDFWKEIITNTTPLVYDN